MDVSRKIMNVLSSKKVFYSFGDIARKLKKVSNKEIKNSLDALIEDGTVTVSRAYVSERSLYALMKRLVLTKAEIVSVKNGFSFARPIFKDREATREDDLYLENINLYGALFKDTVLVAKNQSGHNFIARVLKRGTKSFIGNVKINSAGVRFIVPDNKNMPEKFKIIGPEIFLLQANDKIEVVISNFAKQEAKLLRIIGVKGERESEVISILNSYGFSDVFPKGLEEEIKKVEESEIKVGDRKDFRDLLTITIDNDDSRDFDDALSLEKKGQDLILYVHIADVSHYVPINSKLDKEALERTTSVYFPENVFPMFPLEISTGKCSLNPNEDRYTLTAKMTFSPNGKLKEGQLFESVIRSDYRMTYNNVMKIFNGDKEKRKEYKEVVPMLEAMNNLAKKLKEIRVKKGQMEFSRSEMAFDFDEERNIVGLKPMVQDESNSLIEQFMVRTNEFVAEYLTKKKMPCIFRVHEEPDSEKLDNAIDFSSKLNCYLDKKNFRMSFKSEMEKIKNPSVKALISMVVLRSMMKAKYETVNKGHYGLASESYCHFTSPIRRYPDLMIHRLIKETLHNSDINNKVKKKFMHLAEKAAKRSTDKEINATQAEREVDDFYKCVYMKQFVGAEFNAIISGVSRYGIFVELENSVEGLVRFENLPKDYYEVDESSFVMYGDYNTFSLGDPVRVCLIECNIDTRKLEFAVVENEKAEKSKK